MEDVVEDKLRIYRVCIQMTYNKRILSKDIFANLFKKKTYEEKETIEYFMEGSVVFTCIAKSMEEVRDKYKERFNVDKFKKDKTRLYSGINHSFKIVELVTDKVSFEDLSKRPCLEVIEYIKQELGGINNG